MTSRYLDLGIGVAGPVIGRVLATLLGPIGWLLTAMSVLYCLGDINWEKNNRCGCFRWRYAAEAEVRG